VSLGEGVGEALGVLEGLAEVSVGSGGAEDVSGALGALGVGEDEGVGVGVGEGMTTTLTLRVGRGL
jgi:hypothetical protein